LSSTKALKIGDYLEVDGIYGCVHDINWRSVSLHNPHTDSLYIFPNSAVAEKTILNYSVPTERFKNTISFVVEHGASPELVSRLVLHSLEHSRYVLRDPKPDMNVMGFTDLDMEYRIRYFFDGDGPWWDAQAEVYNAIWGVLRRNGIRLAIDRHKLQSGDELADIPWSREPEGRERAYVVNVLDSLELLHHTDRETGLAVFNELAQGIADDPESGSEKAMSALRRIANDIKISHIVMGIAHGVTGLHGKVTEGERQALEKIGAVLDTAHEPDELAASIKMLSDR
jgi:tellurite resistance protein